MYIHEPIMKEHVMTLGSIVGFTIDLITMIIAVMGIQNPNTVNFVRHLYWFAAVLTVLSNIRVMITHIIRYMG